MKRKISKEQLAIIVNKRFPRISNYLKRLNKTKTINENTDNIAMSIALHKIFFYKIATKEVIDYIITYLKENYIKEYLQLVEENITINDIEQEISKMPTNEIDINETNAIKVYKAIQKEYKSIEIVE